MENILSHFLDSRMEEITQRLLKQYGEYALAVERSKALYENIEPIAMYEKDITISAGDCMDLNELLELEAVQHALLRKTLYKQGYLDCIKLLRRLGLLIPELR